MFLLLEWGYWSWMMLGLVLLILECFIPGVFVMWFGLGALAVAIVMFIFPMLSITLQLILFAVISSIFCFAWVKYQNKHKNLNKNSHLNQRNASMLGQTGIVMQLLSNTEGRAKFGDTTWKIKGDDLYEGKNITVIDVDGIILLVK